MVLAFGGERGVEGFDVEQVGDTLDDQVLLVDEHALREVVAEGRLQRVDGLGVVDGKAGVDLGAGLRSFISTMRTRSSSSEPTMKGEWVV